MKRILFILIILFFIGCKSTVKIVEVPSIKTEYKESRFRDSIYHFDSVTIIQKGDTVFNTKIKYLFKYKFQKDTVNRTDTITVIKTVEIPVTTNELNKFQKISIWGFWSFIVLFISYFLLKKRYFF